MPIHCKIVFIALMAWAALLRAGPSRDALLQCMAETQQFTQEEKEALAANIRSWSRFGIYAVTANAKRACGVALAEDGQFLDKVVHVMEMKAIAAFGEVLLQWQDEYDRLDGLMSVKGRFPAIRERRVFYGKVEPKAVDRNTLQLEDGTVFVVMLIPIDKVSLDKARYETEMKGMFREKLLALYDHFRKEGDLKACVALEGDLRLSGAELPDGAIYDYIQAVSNGEDSVAAMLIDEIAMTFKKLPSAMQKALLETIAGSHRKKDCVFLEEKKDKTAGKEK